MWFPNVAALKSQFRIYAIDTPGQPGKISSVGSPAYSQSDNLALLQILSITGMWGVTFLIMWCASTVNSLWEHQFDWRPVKGTLGGFVVVFLAALLFGSVQLSFSPPSSQTVEAATITLDSAVSSEADSPIDANFNQSTDAQRAAARPKIETSVDQILSRTETALRGGAKMVSWKKVREGFWRKINRRRSTGWPRWRSNTTHISRFPSKYSLVPRYSTSSTTNRSWWIT